MTSYVTHLECSRCGERCEADRVQQTCAKDGAPLLVRYDLARIRESVPKNVLYGRQASLWRYRELLPIADQEDIVSLGEVNTPLYELPVLGRSLGLHRLSVKDEGLLPTGTFKARGAAVGVTRAGELGVTTIALPTAGNAGAAWAAYGARAGIGVVVAMPATTPSVIVRETASYGARVYLVDGSIADAGRVVREACAEHGWYDASTLKEPYRIEGKKTMGFELAEQLGWRLPDVIVYPTGGGVGLIGMWKAFAELREIGWIDAKAPRFIAVQASGCAPIVKAFHEEQAESEPWPDPKTFAAGLRVPKALGDFLVLRILRESKGVAIDVSDERIRDMLALAGTSEGVCLCPEGAAAFEGAYRLRQAGYIGEHEDVVVFNTGSGLKYAESLAGAPPIRLEAGERIPRVERRLEEAFAHHRPIAVEGGTARVAPDEA
ncbi:MAG TPA: threonine synthase [Candidatus Limnocylindria bacterium]|nr:threonine synthase [Candidatus Limnocylindria bacterium]